MSDEARLILGGDKDEIIRRLYGEANVTLHDLDVMREQLRAARRDLAAALVVVLAARVLRVRAWQYDRAVRRDFDAPRIEWFDTHKARMAAWGAMETAREDHRAALAAYVKGEGR